MSRSMKITAAFSLLCAALPAMAASAPISASTYRTEPVIALPDGRWDLVSFDTLRGRVIVARGDSISVVEVNPVVVRSIGTIAHGHAAVAIPGTSLIAITSGQDNTLRLLNADDGHETARITVGQNPDAAIWDPVSARLLVMNAKGGSISIVDPVAARVIRTISVKPALELAAMVGPNLLAINDEDANELELVDLAHGKVLRPITLTGCAGPTGLAFDSGTGLALSACANGKAALIDVRTRKLLRLLPIGAGPDTVLYDGRRHRFLVPCGKTGTLSVFAVGRRGTVIALATVPTELGARTGALDEATGRVYLPTARFQPTEPGKRPELIPGSVHLVVLSPVP